MRASARRREAIEAGGSVNRPNQPARARPWFTRWLDPLLNPEACLPPQPDGAELDYERADRVLGRLEAFLHQKLRYSMAGNKRSLLRGQGLDFADLREYQPGDDIRKMDWNVYARTLSPHVREYHEEKQLTLWLVVDCTPSMRFGLSRTKLSQAIDLAGLIALMAESAHHRLGAFLIHGAGTEGAATAIIPPRTGRTHTQHVMQALLSAAKSPELALSRDDPFPAACAKLAHVVQKHATVLFLSDFLTLSERWDSPLGQLARHVRLISVLIRDPVERALPKGLGLLPVIDPETRELLMLDTDDPSARSAYNAHAEAQMASVMARLRRTGAAIVAEAGQDPVDVLLHLLDRGLVREAGTPAPSGMSDGPPRTSGEGI